MTSHTQLAVTPRDRFREAVQEELIAFERRELEFARRDRAERAERLQIAGLWDGFSTVTKLSKSA
jgi:hypothetical protein